jgi:hypothetical protein
LKSIRDGSSRRMARHPGMGRYIFDGEATVSHVNGIDTVIGDPTFKNTIFTRSVMFAPRKSLATGNNGLSRFAKPAPASQPAPLATFEGDTVFDLYVEFNLPVSFKGGVEFKQKAVFRHTVTFWERPVFSAEGYQHGKVQHKWME